MFGKVVRGLRRPGFGARLRQTEGIVGCRKQRPRRLFGHLLVLERECGFRFHNAVVVVHLVIKAERATRLPFRILDQFDVWRAVGNCSEIPDQIGAEDAVYRGRTIAFDQQPTFLGPGRKRRTRLGWRRLNRTVVCDVETYLAGGADHELTAHWHSYRWHRLRGFPWPQTHEHHRRPAGVTGRRDPGIDAEIGGRHHAAPIESRGDTFCALAAGGEETRDHHNDNERTECHWIAQREARSRPASPELARRPKRTLDMRLPERLRHRVISVGSDAVGNRRRRTVRFTGAAIEPPKTIVDTRQPHDQQWQSRSDNGDCEYEQADGAGQRRQCQPQTGPREGQKQSEHCCHGGESRPQPLPEETAPRARQGPRQQKSCGALLLQRLVFWFVQKALRRSGSRASVYQANTCQPCRPRVYLCAQSQSGMRSSAINWSTSRRGRTTAHCSPLTKTSGTRALVL